MVARKGFLGWNLDVAFHSSDNEIQALQPKRNMIATLIVRSDSKMWCDSSALLQENAFAIPENFQLTTVEPFIK